MSDVDQDKTALRTPDTGGRPGRDAELPRAGEAGHASPRGVVGGTRPLGGDTGEDRPEEVGRAASLWSDAWRDLRTNPLFVVSATLILLFVVMAAFPRIFTSFYPGFDDPRLCDLSRSLQRPDAQHWFGFDLQGCDYYANVVHGARVSVVIGISVTLFAALIAIVFGAVSGYYGGAVDALIARMTDIWFALPFILGGIVVLSVFRNPEAGGIMGMLSSVFERIDALLDVNGLGMVVFTLVLLGWPTMLRLMRSAVIEEKEEDYVEAARSLGAHDGRIIARHILPNAVAPVLVYGTIYVGIVISAEAVLSYLGVGLQLPAISWGLMINQAQHRIMTAPHLLFFPGAFLSVAVLSFILMGDALRDALDPKLR